MLGHITALVIMCAGLSLSLALNLNTHPHKKDRDNSIHALKYLWTIHFNKY